MDIEEYLRFVANKIQEARSENKLAEVKRLLKICATTLAEKAEEIHEGSKDYHFASYNSKPDYKG